MKNSLRLFALLAALAGFMAIAEEPFPAPVDSGTTFMKDAMKPIFDKGVLPGAISILYKDGKQETMLLGYADREEKRPVTMDDLFMQASETKGFCGVTIAILVEEGKLSLDDPVSKYLPEFKTLWVLDSEKDGIRTMHQATTPVTIRMCLNHTAGFPFEVPVRKSNIKGGGWSGGASLRSVAAIAAACPLVFDPGTEANYCNTGFDIAAAVTEVVTGKPWEQFLKERVLDPLGMTSTTFKPTDEMLKNKMTIYAFHKQPLPTRMDFYRWQQPPYNDAHVFPSAAAGLWTTANDQIKFYKMLMNKGVGDNGVRIMKEETFMQCMASNTRPKDMRHDWYSLGLNVSPDGWIGHGGALLNSAYVNWKTKEMKIWIIQIDEDREPWVIQRETAVKKFFRHDFDSDFQNAYTGRTE